MPAANRAAGNVGEVLRGNERPQGATDLATPNPVAAQQAAKRIPCVEGVELINFHAVLSPFFFKSDFCQLFLLLLLYGISFAVLFPLMPRISSLTALRISLCYALCNIISIVYPLFPLSAR